MYETTPRRPLSKRLTAFIALPLLILLSGCYLPVRFDAEIELTRTGYFSFIFDGYLAKVALFDGLRKGKITPEQEKKEVADIEADFARDTSSSNFKYFKRGHFNIHWERKGDLLKTRSVTFVRRNEQVLSINYNTKTGRISVAGRSLKRDTKKQLADIGLNMTGEIRIITDLPVVTHNATKVKKYRKKGPKFKTYTWKIDNIFAPTPSMVLALQ